MGTYNLQQARLAHGKFQEMVRREEDGIEGRGYVCMGDAFRLLNGRERVIEETRTAAGQTVPEQIIGDEWRALLVESMKGRVGREVACSFVGWAVGGAGEAC